MLLLLPLSVCTTAGCICVQKAALDLKKRQHKHRVAMTKANKKKSVILRHFSSHSALLLWRNEANNECKSCSWELHQHKQTQSRA
jgi:hypothetical protein